MVVEESLWLVVVEVEYADERNLEEIRLDLNGNGNGRRLPEKSACLG